jgi:hypothetical protein
MTFNDFLFCFFLLLVTRELYDFNRELKKSNIFWYLHVYLAARDALTWKNDVPFLRSLFHHFQFLLLLEITI